MIRGDPNAHPAHCCPLAGRVSTGHVPGLRSNQINNNNISSGVEMCLSQRQITLSPYHPNASPERSQQIEQDPPHGAGSAHLGFGTAGTSRQSRPGTPSFARGRREKPEQGCAAGAKSLSRRNQGWQLPTFGRVKKFPLSTGTGTRIPGSFLARWGSRSTRPQSKQHLMAMPHVIHKNINKTSLLIQATLRWAAQGPRSSAALRTDGHLSVHRRAPGISLSFRSRANPTGQLPLVPPTAVCLGTGEPKITPGAPTGKQGQVARCPPCCSPPRSNYTGTLRTTRTHRRAWVGWR